MKKNFLLLSLMIAGALKAEKQPNILWIITDDQRADALECWNMATRGTRENKLGYVSSPNINKLASEGVLFTHAFCNSPVSAPSRASMHTGKYTHHSGIYAFELCHNENDYSTPLLPETMHKAGYKTMLFGKLGVRIVRYSEPLTFATTGWCYDEAVRMEDELQRVGITDWCKNAAPKGEAKGTKEYWYYPDGSKVSYYVKRTGQRLTSEDKETASRFRQKHEVVNAPMSDTGGILGGVSPMPTDKTLDGRIAEEFISYLNHPNQKYKILCGREIEGPKSGQPQFINLGFHFPHTPVMPSKEYRDMFKDKHYNLPEFTSEEFNKMPSQLKKWHKAGSITSLTDEQKLQFIRDYYAFCAMGDHLLGKAVEEFKSYCAKRNEPYLIVLACGDHGWHLGEQGVAAKASNYVKSNQTAVIVVSSDKSKFPAGKVVDDLIEYVDFVPTFISAAGLNPAGGDFDYLDGRSLELTANSKVAPRDYVLGATNVVCGHRAYLRSKDFAFSMKTRNFLGDNSEKNKPNENIRWALECPPEDVDMALFDLRIDRDEINNVANKKEYRELAEWFRKKLGNIVLGDDRVECIWNKKNEYNISSFARGCDDKKLDIPENIIPKVK